MPRKRPDGIDLAVRALIEEADSRARDILEAHRADLETGVELLIAKETLTVEDFPPLRGPTPLAPEQAPEERAHV